MIADFTFNWQNVIDGEGVGISVTGMLIVFCALLFITVFISLLPHVLKIVANFLPPENDGHHAGHLADGIAESENDEEILAAIGFALHSQRQQR